MPPILPADAASPPLDEAVWRRAREAAPEIRSPLPAGAPVLVIAAHPDDETIGAGRLLADHAGPAHALTLTAGEKCHGPDADPEAVRHTRLAEWRAALAALGVEPLPCPHHPDGRLAQHEDAAVVQVVTLAGDLGAGAILAPWRHDPHPDHEAAGRIATRAAAATGIPLWSYLVWTPYWRMPDAIPAHGARLFTCPTSPAAEGARDRALGCHRSQIAPVPPAGSPVVPAALLARHDRQLLIRDLDA